MFNPLTMLSAEQQQFLKEVQKFTKDIKAVIHKEGSSLTFTLLTSNPQAEQYLPQIRDAMVGSIAQTLYTLFNITGKVE